jgi:hypothetical protein
MSSVPKAKEKSSRTTTTMMRARMKTITTQLRAGSRALRILMVIDPPPLEQARDFLPRL